MKLKIEKALDGISNVSALRSKRPSRFSPAPLGSGADTLLLSQAIAACLQFTIMHLKLSVSSFPPITAFFLCLSKNDDVMR